MSSPDVHALTGAYALDALDEPERRQLETHLGECPACAREVEELRAVAARLALAVAEQPPQSLRRRVMAQVTTTRQEPSTKPSPVTQPDTRRRQSARREGWTARVATSAAVVAAAAALALGLLTVHTTQQRDALQTEYQALAQLAAAPDARGVTGPGTTGGTAFVLASHQQNKAVLLVSGLSAPPPAHTYQAWLIGPAAHPRSIGLVPAPATPAPLVFGGLDGATKIGLTVEPAGGSAQPTTTPVVLFDLPS